jgi:hypothetical protein
LILQQFNTKRNVETENNFLFFFDNIHIIRIIPLGPLGVVRPPLDLVREDGRTSPKFIQKEWWNHPMTLGVVKLLLNSPKEGSQTTPIAIGGSSTTPLALAPPVLFFSFFLFFFFKKRE